VAPAALLAAGLLLAVSTNLAKVAQGVGITPLAYLTWSLAGASLLLTLVSYFRGRTARVDQRSVEYFVVSGFLTVVGSNLSTPIAMRLLAEPALPAILPSAGLIAAGIMCLLLGVTACQRRTNQSLRNCG
jgi:hypothetical protein